MEEKTDTVNLPTAKLDEDPELTDRQASYNQGLRHLAEDQPPQVDPSTLKFGPLIAVALLGVLVLLTAIYQMLNPQIVTVPEPASPAPSVSAPAVTHGLVSDDQARSQPSAAETNNGSSL